MSFFFGDGLVAPRPTLGAGADGIAAIAPHPALSAQLGYHSITGTAPVPVISAVLITAPTFTGVLIAPAPQLLAVMLTGEILALAGRAPAPTLTAAFTSSSVFTAAGTAPAPRIAAAMLVGQLFTAALRAPRPTIVAAGYPAYTWTAALVAPAPYLDAQFGHVVPSAYRTWVLNTRKLALTEYGSEFAFNSFATYRGTVLACGPSGVVVLGLQDLDNAAFINARARTGQESFESSFHKRVSRIYVSGEFPGDMLFRTIQVEHGSRTYALPRNGITGLQQRRVPIGKGPKSRFWQFELLNVDGADFSTNDILVMPFKLRRRVQ